MGGGKKEWGEKKRGGKDLHLIIPLLSRISAILLA